CHFPSFEADFGFQWPYHPDTPATNCVQELGFHNVRVNLSDFIRSTVAPLLQKIDTALSPFKDIAAALGQPLPVISDLVGHPYTLLNLAKDFGAISQSSFDFVQTVQQFITFSSNVESLLDTLIAPAAGGWIQLGDFSLDATAASDPTQLGKLAPLGTASSNIDQTKLQLIQDAQGFGLPVLKNPTSLFKVLLGQD